MQLQKIARKLRRAPKTLFERFAGHLKLIEVSSFDLEKANALKPIAKDVIVSLTSYPPRFPTLEHTLKSILNQSIRPETTILWISENDFPLIPQGVLALKKFGLTINACQDLKSYKKILPTLEAFPNAHIVIADDDVYYHPHWLEELVVGMKSDTVTCHRAHRITYSPDGAIMSYRDWEKNIRGPVSGSSIFPTGVGGVLYPNGVLHPDVTNWELAKQLCPSGDDIWLFWMASRGGAKFSKIGPQHREISWPGSQRIALHRSNVLDGNLNDVQIQRITKYYGGLQN